MLHFMSGSPFTVAADIRVNTVNCVGVMGKGIALEFRLRYPTMYEGYKQACKEGLVQIGKLHVWETSWGLTIVNLPTKQHWKDPSEYEYIDKGLQALREFLLTRGSDHVTVPALGCGNGGLDWALVRPKIVEYLDGLDAQIFVFEPGER